MFKYFLKKIFKSRDEQLRLLRKKLEKEHNAVKILENFIENKSRDFFQQKEKFRGLLEAAPDAFVIVDKEGKIIMINNQVEVLFGYAREELIGKPVEILVPEHLRTKHVEHRKTYFEQPKKRTIGIGLDLYGVRKDGSRFPVDIALSPLKINGDFIVTAAIRDISEHKQTEEKLRHAAAVSSEAAKREREMSELKSEFIQMTSHELKTPLTHIKAGVSNLEHLKLAPKVRKRIFKIIDGSIHRLSTLISDHLDLEKIEKGKMEYIIKPHHIALMIRNAVESFHLFSKQRGVRLEYKISHTTPDVLVDPDRFNQIMTNLLHNALKFTPEGGGVTVFSNIKGDYLEISVKDTGYGIPKEEQTKVFEKYKQVKDRLKKGQIGGTGLGLPIVKALVEGLGGKMRLESEVNKGSCFSFTVPLAKKQKKVA
ncbi:MAG: PAS domain-containing sensor histidine kinase [Deltaproteobacteria bacterium]|nr:PAS domain-containing sensor histidine kinase [Deltaproteobacteria bacterium]